MYARHCCPGCSKAGAFLALAALCAAAPPPVMTPGAQSKRANVEETTFPREWSYRPGGESPTARHGMVVSNSPSATAAGVEILKSGGNAVDAAVAVGFALAVAYPEAGNLGGGGYTLLRMADGRTAALDYRETAPGAATRDMYVEADGTLSADRLVGHRASGVPGSVAGLLALLDEYGTKPRALVMAPALRLAREGVVVDEPLHESIGKSADLIRTFAGRARFLPGDRPPAVGSSLVQPELLRTLQRIAASGPDGFYGGPVAEAVVAEMRGAGGLITLEDLGNYRPAWRRPLEGSYRGYGLLTMPPSSSGGVTVIETLNILETYEDIAPWGSAASLHRLAGAFQLAFLDRNAHLGDPDVVSVPVQTLTDKAYARGLRARLDEGKATPTRTLQRPSPEGVETTNYAVVDRDGNAVVSTTTLNDLYGSGVWVPEAGFFLNDEMDDFTSRPGAPNQFGLVQGEANAIAPGKRMLSAMAPTIVLGRDGLPLLLVGSRGGPRIITGVTQVILNVIDYGMSLADAMGAPRIHHQGLPDVLQYERGGVPADVVATLDLMGHTLEASGTGSPTAILRAPDGWTGAHDPRGFGLAAGY